MSDTTGSYTPVNNVKYGPQAKDDSGQTTENAFILIDVLANDLGGSAKVLWSLNQTDQAIRTTDGSKVVLESGARVWFQDGKLAYDGGRVWDRLGAGATAVDTFTYAIRLSTGVVSYATVTITITGTNDGPVAVADTASGTENQALTVDVLANDTDADSGHAFTLTAAVAPAGKGVASIANNRLVFTPGADFDHLAAGATEVVVLTYTMKDEHGATSSSTLTVTITGTNDGPVAVADAASGTENQALAIDVLANDTDLDDGHAFTLTAAAAPSGKGAASIANNRLVFTPGTDFDHLPAGATEVVTLTYTMKDEHGAASSSTVTITITGTNDGPVAVADSASSTENQNLTIDVLANDTDLDDGHTFTLTAAGAPAGKGVASIVGNRVAFDPGTDFDHLAAGATEVVTLTYTMKDEHGATSNSTVTVTITGTNDGPVAMADSASCTENQGLTIDVLGNDTDVDDGHAFTLTAVAAPAGKGAVSIANNQLVFAPGSDFDHLAAGATEVVVLTYTMQDEHGATSSSTLTVTITGTNDGPVAVADAASGTENQALAIDVLANDTDVDDGHVFTLTAASAPVGKGAASIVGNQLVFTPGADFDRLAAGATEVVVLTYMMQDEHGSESVSSLTITVTGTNDGPVAVADTAPGTENHAVTIDVLGNDTDVDDGHAFTLTTAAAPAGKGVASIVGNQFVFTPGTDFDHLAAGATEVVTLTYTMQDEHGASSSSTVAVTITGTNDGPVAVADSASGTENQALTIDVLANDTDLDDGHAFTLTAVAAPAGKGVASIVANQLVFNPGTDFDRLAAGATEVVTLTYTMEDEHGATSSSTLTVTITGTNDGPVAVADAASGTENETLTIDVLGNDTDVDEGHAFTLTAAAAPAGKGVASIVGNKLVFTPGTDFDRLAAGATEMVTLTYTMRDEHGSESDSSLTITITGTNDGPVAVADSASGAENETLTIDVLGNDTDLDDAHAFTLTAVAAPSGKGVASIVGNKLVFTPGTDFDRLAAGATEVVTLTYTMEDEHGAPSSSTVAVTITGTNDGPIAVADSASGTENQALTLDVLANDTDVDDGHTFTLTAAAAPSGKGVASIVDNKLVFTPGTDFDRLAAGASEVVTLTYTMEDEHGATSSSTVSVTITGTNDGPVAVADSASGAENETLTIDVLANDTDLDDGHVFTLTAAAAPAGKGVASVVGNRLVFTPGAEFDHLAAGDTEVVTLTYTMEDEHGASSSSTVSVTITGTNDAPVVSGPLAGAATEDGPAVTLDGLANASDVDDGAVLAVQPPAALPAGVTFDPATNMFRLDPAHAAYQSLALGATTTVTVHYAVTDGTASVPASLSWTVTGTNDSPVVTSGAAAASGSVVEAGSSVAGIATAGGTLTSSDADAGASAVWSGSSNGTYGSFAIDAQGVWTYTLDDSRAATGALAPGQIVVESFTATVTDEHGATAQQTITIQITGSEDNRAPTAEDVTLSGTSGVPGGSGVAIPPYSSGSGMIFTRLVDSNGDGVADTPDAPSTLSGGYGTGLATGDIDGDGDIDMVSINGNQIWSYTNVGDTSGDGRVDFVSTQVTSTGNGSQDIALADLNGDGRLDVVYGSYGTLVELINLGDGNGNGIVDDFAARTVGTNGGGGYTYGLATGDVDGDGLADIVIPNYEAGWYGGQPVTLMLNRGDTDGDGQINYVSQGLYPGTNSAMGASIGDLNGDGRADLVISRWDGQGVQVMLGLGDTNGDGQLDFAVSNISMSDYVMETTLADLDGDGDLDLASSGANGSVHIALNQGDSDGDGSLNFTTTAYYVGYGTYGLAVTDLDGDGDLDVFAPNQGGYWNHTASYLNNVGDSNGDGAPDFEIVQLTNVPPSWDAEPLDVGIGSGRGAREDGPAVTGSFVGDDPDSGDAAQLTFEILSQPAEGSVVNNGDGTFGFDPGGDFQDLAPGESRTVTFTYRAVDPQGAASAPATVTVTVAGADVAVPSLAV